MKLKNRKPTETRLTRSMTMKLKNRKPTDPQVTARILKRIDDMTPEEVVAFLEYRTPGVEETDMTGMFSAPPKPECTIRSKRRAASA